VQTPDYDQGQNFVTNLAGEILLVITDYSNLQKPKTVFDMHNKNKSMMNQYHNPQLLKNKNPI